MEARFTLENTRPGWETIPTTTLTARLALHAPADLAAPAAIVVPRARAAFSPSHPLRAGHAHALGRAIAAAGGVADIHLAGNAVRLHTPRRVVDVVAAHIDGPAPLRRLSPFYAPWTRVGADDGLVVVDVDSERWVFLSARLLEAWLIPEIPETAWVSPRTVHTQIQVALTPAARRANSATSRAPAPRAGAP